MPKAPLCTLLLFLIVVQTALLFRYLVPVTDLFAGLTTPLGGDLPCDQAISDGEQATYNVTGSLLDRLSLYQGRYNYRPAAPRTLPSSIENVAGRNVSRVCGRAPTFDAWYRRSLEEGRSVNNEDKTMFETFYRELGPEFKGTFVEMGAFNGITESNSLFFETCLGWEGILIEGNPSPWPNLVKNRPYAHRLHYAPSCNATGEANNASIPFYNSIFTNAGQASSDVKSAYTNNWDKGGLVQVPCGTLTNVLRDLLPGGRVTFFSLDVEGAEPLVVGNAIDFEAVFIEVFMVEQFNALCPAPPRHCESREKVRTMMKEKGYILYDKLVMKSDVYVHPLSDFRA